MTKLREKPPDEVEEEPAPKLDIVHTTQTMMYHAKEETICEDSRAAAKKKKNRRNLCLGMYLGSDLDMRKNTNLGLRRGCSFRRTEEALIPCKYHGSDTISLSWDRLCVYIAETYIDT
jgi:hypothetical protein